jgi:hypothetical protein
MALFLLEKYTVFKFNLYLMVHSNVWKFEKIWLSGTLIIIRKPKVWRTDMRIPINPDSPKIQLCFGDILQY